MLKCASKRLGATFRVGFHIGNVALSKQPASHIKGRSALLNFTPVLVDHINRYYGFGSSCGKFSKGKNSRENPNEKKTSFIGSLNNNVFDALTWGGAFILGYFFLQPFKKSWTTNCYDSTNSPIFCGYQLTVKYLFNSFGLQSIKYVLPEPEAKKRPNEVNSNCNLESKNGTSELERAHEKVSGILSNLIGMQHMESGNHKKGFEFFIQSASQGNAAGIFNLGICHEKGLGTDQDLKRAADLYRRATDLGHASAMYNLGIFHIQGLGGVETDIDLARELFKKAAQLGQKDAAKALKLENGDQLSEPGNGVVSNNSSSWLWLNESIRDTVTNSLENFKVTLEETMGGGDSFGDNDSGVLDLSPQIEAAD
ncbi:hypothetical protein RUM43_007632 [Polyplax serrata]|uniref:Uncharacterized protein n=1 Tax=Polyplax serrata TaxID=468196 RepID=A0AAN8P663_POLSC